MRDEQSDDRYRVVRNHEDQYSLWPAHRDNAPGWSDEGTAGTRDECLRRIEEVWTDMRPASLRQRMTEGAERR